MSDALGKSVARLIDTPNKSPKKTIWFLKKGEICWLKSYSIPWLH